MSDPIERQDVFNLLHSISQYMGSWLVQYIEDGISSIPSAQPDAPDTNVGDMISRQAAIDAMCSACGYECDKSEFIYNAPQDEQVILCPEHYALTKLPSVQPGIIRCKNCKHKPSGSGVNHDISFPDEVCPCQCDDYWYSWMPKDDWYCADAERWEE